MESQTPAAALWKKIFLRFVGYVQDWLAARADPRPMASLSHVNANQAVSEKRTSDQDMVIKGPRLAIPMSDCAACRNHLIAGKCLGLDV